MKPLWPASCTYSRRRSPDFHYETQSMISTVENTIEKSNGKPNGRSNGKKSAGLRALNEPLERFSRAVTVWSGSSWAFTLAVAVVILWAATGPIFHYSDTWQLVINTGTTIVTFLMVFLIQRAQNKDSLTIQIKLNELLASQEGASNRLINLEDWGEEEIVALHQRFANLSERLNHAASGCEAHSIAEAKEVVEEAANALAGAREQVALGNKTTS
jgi:low affinity Fe/Cu permease